MRVGAREVGETTCLGEPREISACDNLLRGVGLSVRSETNEALVNSESISLRIGMGATLCF